MALRSTADGTLSGTATELGESTVTIQVTDSAQSSATREFTLLVLTPDGGEGGSGSGGNGAGANGSGGTDRRRRQARTVVGSSGSDDDDGCGCQTVGHAGTGSAPTFLLALGLLVALATAL